MKKSTKAAIATGAAAVLLLGGAGTLAYWTADGEVDAGTLTAGDLTYTVGTCGDWTFADADTEGAGTVTAIVPGDTVEKVCSGTIDGSGDHLQADVEVDQASVDAIDPSIGTEDEELTVTAAITDPASPPVAITGPTNVDVTITVNFPYGGAVSAPDPETDAKNSSQLDSTTLDNIRVVAVQVHD